MASDIEKKIESVNTLKNSAVQVLTPLEKIQESLSAIAELAKKLSESLPETKQIEDLAEAAENINESTQNLAEKVAEAGKEKLEELNDAAKNTGKSLDISSVNVKDLSKASNFKDLNTEVLGLVAGSRTWHSVWRVLSQFTHTKMSVGIAAVIGLVSGLRQGLKNIIAVSKATVGFLGQLSKGTFRFGASIAAIPFRLFQTLIDVAESGPMGTEYMQAIENLRKEFGSLKNDVNKSVFEISRSFKGFNQTGLSTFRVFGNIIDRLDFLRENFKAMGFAFEAIHGELKEAAGVLFAYQKALGMTGEDMKGMTEYAVSMGKSLESVQNDITKHTLAFSGGVIDKRFSRQVVKAVQDVKHFGGATIKQVSQAAEYAKGLRVELEKIVGTLDAFETFDAAAENASKLSQSFGMSIDAFKLMEAQSPDEQVNMLRKSFFAAGKSADQFSRQQLKLLSQTTGLDEATAKLVFSQNNRGKSLDEIKKQGSSVEKQQLSQAEAMEKVADAIERMVKPGMQMKGGYFDQFFKGMARGITWSREFRTLMWEIRKGLRMAYWEGIKFGQFLVKSFPGVKEIFAALTDVLNAKNIKKKFAGIRTEFETFIKALSDPNGKASFGSLMKNLQKHFFGFLDQKEPGGKKLLAGIKKFFVAIGTIFAQGIAWSMQQMASGFSQLTEIFKDPRTFFSALKNKLTKGGGIVAEVIMPMFRTIADAWPEFSSSFLLMMKTAFATIKKEVKQDPLKSILDKVIIVLFTVLAGPVATRVLTSQFLTVIAGGLASAFKGVAESSKTRRIVWKFANSVLGKTLGVVAGIAIAAAVGMAISDGFEKYKDKITGSFSDAEKTIAAGTAGIVDSLTLGLVPEPVMIALANLFAKAAVSVKDILNSLLGGLGTDVMNLISSGMKTLAGFGDLLVGLFKGDNDKVKKGLVNLVVGGIEYLWEYMKFTAIKLPMLALKLITSVASTLMSSLADLVADGFEALGFTGISEVFRDISKFISKWGTIIANVFDTVSSAITIFSSYLKKGISIIGDIFSSDGEAGGIIKFLDKVFMTYFKFVFSVITSIIEGFSGKTNSAIGKITFIIYKVLSWITPIGIAYQIFKFTFGAIIALFSWLYSKSDIIIKEINWTLNELSHGFSQMSDWIIKKFSELTNFIKNINLAEIIEDIFGDIIAVVGKQFPKIAGALRWLVDLWKTQLKWIIDVAKDLGPLLDMVFQAVGGEGKLINYDDLEGKAVEAGQEAAEVTQKGMAEGVKKATEAKKSNKSVDEMSLDSLINFDFSNTKDMSTGQLKSLSSSIDTIEDTMKKLESFDDATIYSLTEKLSNVFRPNGPMQKFVEALNASPLEDVMSAEKVMKGYAAMIESSAAVMKAGGMAVALQAVQDMVDSANKLEEMLNATDANKVNVLVNLKKLANAVGLGGKMRYNINNKNVQIHLDVTVKMEADTVEKVIIQRRSSVIRDRLNSAQYDEQHVKRASPFIPEDGPIPMMQDNSKPEKK